MSSLFLTLTMLVSGSSIPDGSLLFLENSNAIVERYTSGKITHVAIAFQEENQVWVYEATPGRVRRIELSAFLSDISQQNIGRNSPIRIWQLSSSKPYSDQEIAKMRGFLTEQVSRRYSIKNYVRNRPGDGIHCAELVSGALMRSGRYDLGNGYDQSPQKVFDAIMPSHVQLDVTPETPKPTGTWCDRSWSWWCGAFDWCGWSCYETWTFCR